MSRCIDRCAHCPANDLFNLESFYQDNNEVLAESAEQQDFEDQGNDDLYFKIYRNFKGVFYWISTWYIHDTFSSHWLTILDCKHAGFS